MSVPFTRQLGRYQPGIQLNPLQEVNFSGAFNVPDQTMAIAARLTRGRIDKPFVVDQSNFEDLCGKGEPIRLNALNEAYIHMFEAINKGAYELVVHRLHTLEAQNNWMIAQLNGNDLKFSVAGTDIPETDFVLAIKHLNCHNDGIKIAVHAVEQLNDNDEPVATDRIKLQILDSDDDILHDFEGSLNPNSRDDYNESDYITNVVSTISDEIEVIVGATQEIPATACAYGRNSSGYEQYQTSDILLYFTEGSTGYELEDYARARQALRYTEHDYAYVSLGGSTSPAFISQMISLVYDTNRQMRIDIPGHLTPKEAVQFVRMLNIDSHLVSGMYWAPLLSDDPIGLNGKGFYGTATRNIAYACARNAVRNAKGFSRKHYGLAGKDYPLDRTGVIQQYNPTDQELDELAEYKITPVIYKKYEGGGSYVFTDIKTAARTDQGYRGQNTVVDMSTTIDHIIALKGNEVIMKPMEVAIKLMTDFIRQLFEDAKAAGWIKPSQYLEGEAYQFQVIQKPRRIDCMDIHYWLHYETALRQIFQTQTIVRRGNV